MSRYAPKKRRRAKGEGGLYQRADGMWMAQVLLPDGKYYQRGRKKYADAVPNSQPCGKTSRTASSPTPARSPSPSG
ncbi:hypothetical protein [Gordonia westfalica]|uniref:hypothetical protein n=1 Tax=Gordonia westfalica TaxID=158898 RepID=UPI00111375D0|nr:hypothetical protein [Gordonia westfalica]